MKKLTFTFLFVALATLLQAQCDNNLFNRLMNQGDAFAKQNNYQKAINKYSAAMIACTEKAETVRKKIVEVFVTIEALKNKAETSEKRVLAQKLRADSALAKANQLIEVLMPSEAKTDPFGYFWRKGKQSIAQYNYPQAYTEFLMAKNAQNLPATMRDSANNLFAVADWYYQRYKQATAYFYQNNFAKAKSLFDEIYKKNPNDSLCLFYAKACADFKTEDMVLVKGGSFHPFADNYRTGVMENVIWTLTDYSIAKHETTNAQYARFLNQYTAKYKDQTQSIDSIQNQFIDLAGAANDKMKSGIYFENGIYKVVFGYENRPVAWVLWYGADAFCRFYGLRLPSEAQWEFAARGGNVQALHATPLQYAGTNSDDSLHLYAWYDDNSNYRTHAVCTKLPNPLGIYDLSGNLWEWSMDWYMDRSDYKSAENPVFTESGSLRVYRGGSWGSGAAGCRSANRYNGAPAYRYNFLGFRLVCSH